MVDNGQVWDGRGLPPAARRRIARAKGIGQPRTALLPVNGTAGLEAAGFDVVCEVLGTAVMQIGWSGYGGCGWLSMDEFRSGGFTVTSSDRPRSQRAGFAPYVNALKHGRKAALDRMTLEASSFGADGVVGIRLTDTLIDGAKHEFVALGTAVRARGTQRPGRVFTTDLGGQDVAKLLQGGWVPAGLAYGISVSIRHDDIWTRSQTGYGAGNVEVSGYTELITDTRADARREFARYAAALGGDAALLSSMRHHVREIEVAEDHRDHMAECVITGNVIARYHDSAFKPPTSLTFLPLRSTR